jgi:hypothetical protein
MARLCVWLLLAVPLLLAGCPEVESSRVAIVPVDPHAPVNPWQVIGPLGGGGEEPGGQPVTLTVTGTVTYERLPVSSQGLGTPVTEPARGVLVEVVHHRDIKIVFESTTTDQAGNFSITFTTDIDYFVRARAQSGTGTDVDRVLHNRTNPLIAHAIPSQVFKRSEGSRTVNLHGTHGLPQIRGGAFAVLDTVQRLRESVSGTFPAFGPVDVFWSVGNLDHPFEGAQFATGSGLDGPLGNASILLVGGSMQAPYASDYDHYDETVIAHEWSHLLMFQFSRDNNFGGPHAGEAILPNAAWGEGVVNAIGCGLLGETVYRDTVGYPPGQSSVQFEFDLESGLLPGSGTGYGTTSSS